MTNRTTFHFWKEDEHWKATEPAADHDLVGRGETAPAAVKHYAEALEEATSLEEVPADD